METLDLARCFIFCWLSFSNVQKSNMSSGYDPYYVEYWFFYGDLVFWYYASGLCCQDSGERLGFVHPSLFSCSCVVMVLISGKQWGLFDELILQASFSIAILNSGYLFFFSIIHTVWNVVWLQNMIFGSLLFEHSAHLISYIWHCWLIASVGFN